MMPNLESFPHNLHFLIPFMRSEALTFMVGRYISSPLLISLIMHGNGFERTFPYLILLACNKHPLSNIALFCENVKYEIFFSQKINFYYQILLQDTGICTGCPRELFILRCSIQNF